MEILKRNHLRPEHELNFPIFVCPFCGTVFKPESLSEIAYASDIAQEISFLINTRVSEEKSVGCKSMLFKSFCPSCGHTSYSNQYDDEGLYEG